MDNTERIKRQAWVVMFVAFYAGIAMAWAQNKIPPVIGIIMESFSINMTTAGWLSSIFCVMGIVMAIPAAALISKWGLKKCGIVALGSCIIGGLTGIIAPNVTILMCSRLLEGIGVGLIAVIVPSIIAMWFPAEHRGLPMGIWGSWQMVAQAAGFLLAGSIIAFMGWKGMWWFGLFLLVSGILLYIWKIASPPPDFNYANVEDRINIADALRSKSVWLLFLIACFFCIACFGWCTWAALYFHEELGLEQSWANSIVGFIYMLEIGTVILEGYILDKIKSRKLFGLVTGVLYAFILFMSFRLPSASWILPFAIIYPFLEGAICTTFWTITPQSVKDPNLASAALAILVMGMNIGMVLGPPLAGYFIQKFSWGIANIPMSAASFICGILFIVVKLYNDKGQIIKG